MSTAELRFAGLTCPTCDYALAGLAECRCPECGEAFDPESLANPRPQIAFERWTGGWRVAGFFVTAATVLFTPWRFAQQAVLSVSVRCGLVFGAACFFAAFPLLAFASGSGLGTVAYFLAWWTTAIAYVLTQTTVLTIFDRRHWRQLGRSWAWWLAVSGYTSAIVLTEILGPPPSLPSLFGEWGALKRDWPQGTSAQFVYVAPYLFVSAQVVLWATGLAVIFAYRAQRPRTSSTMGIAIAAFVWLTLILMYGAAWEHVGVKSYWWFRDLLGVPWWR